METLQVLRMCHFCSYRQEALNESIGACTNDLALCIHPHNGKGTATATLLLYKICLHFA